MNAFVVEQPGIISVGRIADKDEGEEYNSPGKISGDKLYEPGGTYYQNLRFDVVVREYRREIVGTIV